MFRRTRYQQGCVAKEQRNNGPDVWIFRWRELDPDGRKVNRKVIIGTVNQYPIRAAAQKAADALRLHVNKETARAALLPLTCEQLISHYVQRELSEHSRNKAYSTKAAYKCYLENWILPRWQSHKVCELKTVAVEEWLGSLSLAAGTKAKLRNIMSALFNHAIRFEWLDRNPITLVRQSAKREYIPHILDVEELRSLIAELEHPYKAMVAAATGLRASELLGLKWQDVDFESLEINLKHGVVHQNIGELKTEASRKPIPLDPELAKAMFEWRCLSAFNQTSD